ncbi:hypothetical protein HA052_11235 [Chromobacterium haemolyticum]|uniref:Uncharacterized protein n=1 Tax=Chromobacterium fluminis TaxID=3044269 RepID=A0ABX0L862_9NEIS|nr:hypothetical protein [Chromobacterium haemolyticum]NHR05772.1 hypothetical protein [Chromobacterium haemolyticum]
MSEVRRAWNPDKKLHPGRAIREGIRAAKPGDTVIKARFYRVSTRFTYINKNKLIDCFSISRAAILGRGDKAKGRNGVARCPSCMGKIDCLDCKWLFLLRLWQKLLCAVGVLQVQLRPFFALLALVPAAWASAPPLAGLRKAASP